MVGVLVMPIFIYAPKTLVCEHVTNLRGSDTHFGPTQHCKKRNQNIQLLK